MFREFKAFTYLSNACHTYLSNSWKHKVRTSTLHVLPKWPVPNGEKIGNFWFNTITFLVRFSCMTSNVRMVVVVGLVYLFSELEVPPFQEPLKKYVCIIMLEIRGQFKRQCKSNSYLLCSKVIQVPSLLHIIYHRYSYYLLCEKMKYKTAGIWSVRFFFGAILC